MTIFKMFVDETGKVLSKEKMNVSVYKVFLNEKGQAIARFQVNENKKNESLYTLIKKHANSNTLSILLGIALCVSLIFRL